jgi:glycosyltransferase involved in cell wall biosynthesis
VTARPDRPRAALGVVMLLGWNGLGGTQRQALKLAAALRTLGAAPVVVSRWQHGLARHETIERVAVHRIGRAPRDRFLALTFLVAFLAWIVRHRRAFHVVHAHNLPAALTAALLQPLLRLPVIVKLPNAIGIEAFRRRWLGALRWIVLRRCVDRFVAVNAEIEQRLSEQGVPRPRIVRIPNGVAPASDPEPSELAVLRRTLGLAADTRVVVYVGRLVPDKGLSWLLEAWKDVAAAEPRGRLLVVGDGPDAPRLRALADRLAVMASVSFLGSRDDVDRLLAVADVLTLPSRSEGMSNALLEGMASGLAVVASDVPGNRAVIDHGRDGLLVAPGDPARLAAALLDLVRDGALRARLGREAAAKARSAFSIDAVAQLYDGLYRELVADRRAGALSPRPLPASET